MTFMRLWRVNEPRTYQKIMRISSRQACARQVIGRRAFGLFCPLNAANLFIGLSGATILDRHRHFELDVAYVFGCIRVYGFVCAQ